MHGGELGLGRESVRIVVHQGEIAQPNLDPLGDRDLGGYAAEDELPGGIDPLAGQGVNHIVPGASLDLIERFGRRRTALAGQHRHKREIRSGASSHAREPTPNVKNSPPNPLKGLTTSNYVGRSARDQRAPRK